MPISVRFTPRVTVEVQLVRTARRTGHRKISVRVEFPDEARSILETVSWPRERSLTNLLEAMSVRCAFEHAPTLLSDPDGAMEGGSEPGGSAVSLPLATFRAWLEQELDRGKTDRRRGGLVSAR